MKYGNLKKVPMPPSAMKEAMKQKIAKYKNDKGTVSKTFPKTKPLTEKEMANAKPKPMPKPPRKPSGRPVPARPGMTYRGGKKQKERVLAKLKQMRENA